MVYVVLFFSSIAMTFLIKLYAHKKAILDIPNERSSHQTPTPRGGGLSIIFLFYMGLFYFYFYDSLIESRLFYALLCAIPIVLISWLDDIYTLSSKVRFSVQLFSAFLALYALGGVEKIDLILFSVEGFWLNIIAFIAIVWLTNLYNFLDGIDGYAGAEAVSVGLGLFILFHNPLGLVIVAVALGFLVFNWHKASIFMGDVGSASLGFLFGVFVFYDTSEGNILIWMILLSLFWVDATFTLLRRYHNGERLSQAHRKHAYQRLVQSGWSHNKVVLFALLFNLLFLFLCFFVENLWMLFGLNMVALIVILRWVETQKRFE